MVEWHGHGFPRRTAGSCLDTICRMCTGVQLEKLMVLSGVRSLALRRCTGEHRDTLASALPQLTHLRSLALCDSRPTGLTAGVWCKRYIGLCLEPRSSIHSLARIPSVWQSIHTLCC